MSDLVSRKQISNYIKAQINPYGKPFKGTTYELGLKIMEYIDNMNSAYDVDKVVEELEDKMLTSSSASAEAIMEMCGVSATFYNGEYEAYKHAIEIVRGGGVNEIKN